MKKIILNSLVGYFLIWLSAFIVWLVVSLSTGYWQSLELLISLICFRLNELSILFIFVPLVFSFIIGFIFSKFKFKGKIVSGLNLSLYYIIAFIVFLVVGAGEFPYWLSLIWMIWVFVLGVLSLWVYRKVFG